MSINIKEKKSILKALNFIVERSFHEKISSNQLIMNLENKFLLKNLVQESNNVCEGDIFVAIAKDIEKRKLHIKEALEKGSVLILSEIDEDNLGDDGSKSECTIELIDKSSLREINDVNDREGDIDNAYFGLVPKISINGLSKKLYIISSEFYNNPSHKTKVIGVTGTNGKTSITFMIASILEQLGNKVALIGTTGYGMIDDLKEASHTTPMTDKLQHLIAGFVNHGVDYVVAEVSSHALEQKRADGIKFNGAVFSNLSHDHLDYHKTMEEYEKAKFSLFSKVISQEDKSIIVINLDDECGQKFYSKLKGNDKHLVMGFGLYYDDNSKSNQLNDSVAGINHNSNENKAQLTLKILKQDFNGFEVLLSSVYGNYEFYIPIFGKYNLSNIGSSILYCLGLGYSLDLIKKTLDKIKLPRGRLEKVSSDFIELNDLNVFVDYAHTPDALENALLALREHSGGELIVVFGCGGNRDKTKRPEMGQIACKIADKIIITSDNPRYEEPNAIIADIIAGIDTISRNKVISITQRKEAIKYAIESSQKGSTIIIAGKGHETYQDIKGVKDHFDDVEECKMVIK